jgi:hypothetical protein
MKSCLQLIFKGARGRGETQTNKRAWSFPVNADDEQIFVFDCEFRNCHALSARSWLDEIVKLDMGLWVVLWVYPWSNSSALALPTAIETISELHGNAQLGIRCGDGEWHLHQWCPLAQPEASDPVWLFLRDGEIVGQEIGFMGKQQIINRLDI